MFSMNILHQFIQAKNLLKNKGLDLKALIMAESIKDRDCIQTDFEGLDIEGEQLEASIDSIERFSGFKSLM